MLVRLHVLLLLSLTVFAENNTLEYASSFLRRFGYLNESSDLAIYNINEALYEFQEKYNLPVTGTLNEKTISAMNRPRCTVGDYNFSIHSKWNKTKLRWYFPQANTSPKYIDVVQQAFNMWENISNLEFIHVKIPNPKPDITISVGPNEHRFRADCQGTSKCPFNFDGPGKVLAHAYFPSASDDCIEIHLDSSERWCLEKNLCPDDQSNFLSVLMHEIGHSLGLAHSNVESSVMYPWYQENMTTFNKDDILAMERLYGPKKESNVSMTTTPETSFSVTPTTSKIFVTAQTVDLNKTICSIQAPDFMFLATAPQFPNYRLYVGYNTFLWKFDLNQMNHLESPELITDYLPRELKSSRVSQVFQNSKGQLITFANNRYYAASFPNLVVQKSFEFSSVPSNTKINALFQTNSGQIYLIYKDNSYIEFNDAGVILNRGPISYMFPGIPDKITSAFRYTDGFIYFFQNNTYYKYSEYTRKVVAAGPFNWQLFGIFCPEDGLLKQLQTLLVKIISVYK